MRLTSEPLFLIVTVFLVDLSVILADGSFFAQNQEAPPVFSDLVREVKPLTISELDQILGDMQKCNNLPAIGVSIVSLNASTSFGSTFNFTRSFGKSRLVSDTLANEQTGFCIGSITKSMTSILLLKILRLASQKDEKYNMTTLLKELDPSLDFEGSSLRDVTLEDLLSHQTGLPEIIGPLLFGYPPDLKRKELAQIVAKTPRIYPNREKFHYNNHAYSLAGYASEILAEKIKGHHVSWETLMTEYIFEPLGMANQIQFSTSLNLSTVAAPYFSIVGELVEADKQVLEPIGLVGPSGSICLSPNAMTAWLQMLLSDGKYNNQQVVEADDIQNAWEQRVYVEELSLGYGLGFMIGQYKGHRVIAHTGDIPPYISSMAILPDLKIAMLSSASSPDLLSGQTMSRFHILDRLLGLENLTSIPCQNTLNWTRPDLSNSFITLNHKEYIGTYGNPVFGKFEIVESNGELQMLIGQFGNITIQCKTSETKCDAKFNGILWFMSNADSSMSAEKLPNTKINFWKNKEEQVHTISMPWYSPNYLLEFRRVLPKNSSNLENGVDIRSCSLLILIFSQLVSFSLFVDQQVKVAFTDLSNTQLRHEPPCFYFLH